MNNIITIGREFSSGGRELGRKLAEELGYEFYDKEIITEIAKNTSLSEQYVQQVIEKNPHDLFPITVAHTFSYVDSYTMNQKQSIYSEQEKVLKNMAEKSNCVIVGRCADYILKDYNPFRIFVYSNMDCKVKRCKEKNEHENLTDKKLIKQIKNIDKARAKFYNFYTGQKWGDKAYYDVFVNTSTLKIDDIVPQLAKMLEGQIK